MEMEQTHLEAKHFNPLDTCELRLKADIEKDGVLGGEELLAELRIATSELEYEDVRYNYGFLRARLHVVCEGCEAAFGSRAYEAETPKMHEKQESRSETASKVHGAAGVDLKNSKGFSAGVSGGGSGEKTKGRTTYRTQERAFGNIVARPNNTWELFQLNVDGSNSWLGSTFLSGDCLMRLAPKAGDNRLRISAEVRVSKADVEFESSSGNPAMKRLRKNRNRAALINAVAVKALSREADRASSVKYDGVIVLSRSVLS